MKKKIIVITLLVLAVMLTGCQNKDPELEKLTSYLENSQFYNCKNSTCQKEEINGNTKKTYTYDFEKNIHTTKITIGSNNSSVYEYNWKKDQMNVTSTNIDITITATYDFFTNAYDCSSKSSSDTYITSECEKIKSVVESEKDKIITAFNNSGSKYHISN